MKSYLCSQQERISSAIQSGQWPAACDPELHAHVESCATCQEVVVVAQALRQSRNTALPLPQLSSPGLLWWRAQIRCRNAAIERITRPIAIAEIVALLSVLLAALVLVAWQHQQLASWLATMWQPLSTITQLPGLLIVGLGSLTIFGAFAVYLLRVKE